MPAKSPAKWAPPPLAALSASTFPSRAARPRGAARPSSPARARLWPKAAAGRWRLVWAPARVYLNKYTYPRMPPPLPASALSWVGGQQHRPYPPPDRQICLEMVHLPLESGAFCSSIAQGGAPCLCIKQIGEQSGVNLNFFESSKSLTPGPQQSAQHMTGQIFSLRVYGS